jgi:Spy/CpxP family protein refolding chaperone
MKRRGSLGISIVIMAVVACNGHNAATGASDAESEAAPLASATEIAPPEASSLASAAASASGAPSAPAPHHRGLVGMFFRAALDAGLTDETKASIAKLEDPLREDTGARHEMNAIHGDLIESLKEGKMETGKLQADEVAFAKASGTLLDEQAAALSGLHDALTPDQRKTVADAVRAAQAAHERPPSTSDAGANDAAARRLAHMKSQLVLDEDQQRQVGAILARETLPPSALQARFEASKKQVEAAAAAFEKDAFDAKKLDLSNVPGKKPTDAVDRQIKYITAILPVLTAGQRDRLALLMEHPRGGAGRGESIGDPIDMAH